MPVAAFRFVTFGFIAALLALVCLPATATAEKPSRLQNQITDHIAALDTAAKRKTQDALDELYTTHRIRLWVVYVGDFSGQSPQQWAENTSKASSLGDRDVLLAVAVSDRAYYIDPIGLPKDISDSELEDIDVNKVAPALHDGDWAGAAIAAANGISDAMSTSDSSSTTVLLVGGGAIVAGTGGVLLWSRKRRRDRLEASTKAAREADPTDTTVLAGLPLPALDARAKEILVEMDNALRTSEEELELAKGEFGDVAARPFIDAFAKAKNTLAQAFSIRQRLDDNIPETEEQTRDMLIHLISTIGKADKELDAVVAEFDGMRDLLINASDRLDALTRDIVDLTARIPNSETTLASLTTEFPAPALAPVKDNVSMAQERLTFADKNIGLGRDAVALPAGKQGPAVFAIRTAESAVTQARALLDAVDRAAADIRHAIATLPAALDDARRDIAAAADLVGYGGPELGQSKSAAEAAVSRAEAVKDTNPLGAFNEIVAADVELDNALAAATEQKQNAERLAQQVDQALTAAQSQVAAASDFISTRRGVVDAEARTRLSEAQRQLDDAQRLRASDPSRALAAAQAALGLGARALSAAQSDVSQWESQTRSTQSGGHAGAVLGGILIDSMLRGGLSGSRGGSFGPGSFGGTSSSRRIGRGGRF